MRATFHDLSLVQHADLIGMPDRRETMGNSHCSTCLHQALEGILHPMIQHRMIKKIRQAGVEDVPFVFLSVPLLFETGMDALCDETWCLSLPVEEQIRRVMARDDMTREEAVARIESQMPLEEKCRRASLVIRTNRPIEATQAELAVLLRELRRRLG